MLSSDAIPDTPETPRLVTAAQLAVWLQVSTRTITNWSKAGILPKPVKLSPRKTLFRTDAVREALKAIEEERWVPAETNGHD